MTYLQNDPRHSNPPRKWLLLSLLLATCLPLWLSGCGSDEKSGNGGNGGNGANGRPAITVTWAPASEQQVREVRHAVGSIEALASPAIAAQVSGAIESIHVEEGERVERGEILANIEAADHRDERASAAADVARLRAQVEVQQRNLRRTRELYAEEHISEDEVDNAEAELESREQRLAAAQAKLRRAERDLARTSIRADIDGVVSERLVSTGDYVSTGTPLFNLVDLSRLRVRIPLSERLVGRIDEQTPLKLRNHSEPQHYLETTVAETRPEISSSTLSMHLLAFIDNPGNWQPGASVDAEVVLDIREDVVLPTQSVVRRPAGHVAYILSEDGNSVIERKVETGARMGDRVEITSGIEPGDKVIVDGAGFLSDGAKVRAQRYDASSAVAATE